MVAMLSPRKRGVLRLHHPTIQPLGLRKSLCHTPDMATAVRIRGPFLGPSGYDNHVRQFSRELARRGIAVQLENLERWGPAQLPYQYRDPWFESLGAPVDARSVLHFSFPDQVQPDPRLPNINFTMFEATRIARTWAEAQVNADLIVVPTEHSRRAWVDSGVPASKLRLCPLGVRADLFRPGVPPLDLKDENGRPLSSYSKRFLNVSELSARKNFPGLLRAWLRATTPADDAVLILKLGAYNAGSIAAFRAQMEEAQQLAGKCLDEAAPVHLLHTIFPDADMPRVYALGTHYVSLSFGEGWDLSMVQSAAAGLRLIAPRHSAYEAYLDDDVATLISAREVPAKTLSGDWVYYLFENACWWVPDHDEAVQAIRDAIDGRDAPSASARDRIVERFTWEKATDRLIEILDEAEAMSSRR
jgi:glycosyltransferase involved in cell wall biosynthesis